MRIATLLQALVAVAFTGLAFGASAAPPRHAGYHGHQVRHHRVVHHRRPVHHRPVRSGLSINVR